MSAEQQQPARTRLLSIATANLGRQYTQKELIELFAVRDRKIAGLFANSHIASRNLSLPEPNPSGSMPTETSLELWKKHREQALITGQIAIERALECAGMKPFDVDYFACVTSTGFLCPGLTAHYIKALAFRKDIHRIDLVGMGCNGGLNGMQPLVNYCSLNADGHALLVCVEICSAAYVFEMTMRTAVVNSLFGDGAAAAVFGRQPEFDPRRGPEILGFESHILPDQIDAIRFDYDGSKYSFFLDREIPYVLGAHVRLPVSALLDRFGLRISDIKHWIIHAGGQKVINAIKSSLDLSGHDVRHTESVLRDFGNLSSGSFLFSHQRLIEERVAQIGDYLMMVTMGPGATIECCLGRF